MGNMADIVDAAFSKENLSSENPRLIGAGTNIQKLARCLRGDGDLFEEFVTNDVKLILDPLTKLYALYTPPKGSLKTYLFFLSNTPVLYII